MYKRGEKIILKSNKTFIKVTSQLIPLIQIIISAIRIINTRENSFDYCSDDVSCLLFTTFDHVVRGKTIVNSLKARTHRSSKGRDDRFVVSFDCCL